MVRAKDVPFSRDSAVQVKTTAHQEDQMAASLTILQVDIAPLHPSLTGACSRLASLTAETLPTPTKSTLRTVGSSMAQAPGASQETSAPIIRTSNSFAISPNAMDHPALL